MVVIYAVGVALLIVSGQALWKVAVNRTDLQNISLFSADGITKLLSSGPLLAGVLIYAFATLLYIYLLSKFDYYRIQSLVVGASLIITALAAYFIFHETISTLNALGIILIIVGALCIAR